MARKISTETQNIVYNYMKEFYSYDSDSGKFIRVKESRNSNPVGTFVGTLNEELGYYVANIKCKLYYIHRLVWLYHYGEYPSELIDHINGDRADNRLSNLRLASYNGNQYNRRLSKNNKSGYKGVSWCKVRNKWLSQCMIGKKHKFLGYYDTADEASEVYQKYTKIHHGEFYNNV